MPINVVLGLGPADDNSRESHNIALADLCAAIKGQDKDNVCMTKVQPVRGGGQEEYRMDLDTAESMTRIVLGTCGGGRLVVRGFVITRELSIRRHDGLLR